MRKDGKEVSWTLVASGNGKVELREYESRPFGEWDIDLKLEASGVSAGTESHFIRNLAGPDNPSVFGYSPIARVVGVGKEASSFFSEGDRVAYFGPSRSPEEPLQSFGAYRSRSVLNVNPEIHDYLAPDQFCVKVPEALSSELAAFGGIAAVSSMGATMPATKPGDKVLVLGQGVIGQFAAQHFRMHGAEVAVSDLHDKRLTIAAACGADHVIHAGSENTAEAVRALWPNGADIVADSTGLERVIEASLPALKIRGKYVFLGWCKGNDFSLVNLQGQRCFEAFFPWTLEGRHVEHSWRMMLQGGLRVEPLITHRASFRDAPAVYDMVLTLPEQYVGVAFDWTEEGDRA